MKPDRLPGGELWAIFLLVTYASEEEPKTARELIELGRHPTAEGAGDATFMALADKLKRRLGELAFYQLADSKRRGGQPSVWWPTARGRAWWEEHGAEQAEGHRHRLLSKHVGKALESRVRPKWRAYAQAYVDSQLGLRARPSRRPSARWDETAAVESLAQRVLDEEREATGDGRTLLA